jgi:hypothetical protein
MSFLWHLFPNAEESLLVLSSCAFATLPPSSSSSSVGKEMGHPDEWEVRAKHMQQDLMFKTNFCNIFIFSCFIQHSEATHFNHLSMFSNEKFLTGK